MAANGNIKVLLNKTNQTSEGMKGVGFKHAPGKTKDSSVVRFWVTDEDKVLGRDTDNPNKLNGISEVVFSKENIADGTPEYVFISMPVFDPVGDDAGNYVKEVSNPINPYKKDWIDPWGNIIYDAYLETYPMFQCGNGGPDLNYEYKKCPNEMGCVKLRHFTYPPNQGLSSLKYNWGYCIPNEQMKEMYAESVEDKNTRLMNGDHDTKISEILQNEGIQEQELLRNIKARRK